MGLGKNPLLKEDAKKDEYGLLTEEEAKIIKSIQSDADQFITMSFKVRKTRLKKLRDYAFTNRLEIKEALDQALEQYLDGVDDSELLEYPEKPKKTRKRGTE